MQLFPNAKFITSAAAKSQFITGQGKPIIAVSGKSNVGKSSFINALAGQKKLAKVSGDPGRTRLINYFDFGTFILADLPGYGYARVSKAEKAKWSRLLDDFFEIGEVAHVISLCDIRHEPTADDKLMLNFLYAKIIPFTVVANKADKLSRAQIDKALGVISTAYKCGRGDIVAVSSKSGYGLDKLKNIIEGIIILSKQQNTEEDEPE
ncbi:MAG: ribosome biogenesis GTP-binding protein YihA/YsxC [Candidatus Coproplasma sp.]